MGDRPPHYNGKPGEVTFLAKDESIVVQMLDLTKESLTGAAGTLRARFFVTTTHDGRHHVYDRNAPHMVRQWKPLRSFEPIQGDAAVMFAIMKKGMG